MNKVDCSLPELVSMLRTAEADLDIGKSKYAVMFLRSSSKTAQNEGGSKKNGKAKKKKKSIKKEKPQGVKACFHCGKQGHWKKDYKEFLAFTIGASGSGTYMIELYVASYISSTWVLDTGCGTNICNSWQGLRSARQLRAEEEVDLRLGDG
ncbi:hypothetical protein CFOL_v3_00424 [Cephalotus follicularis]|uniref:CCHC-type domain-containing protein n=1 Tax=Cephalotus follicularis TaxID=3775 RepID=A0A1Q3AMX1_CEPFO|nr:hypothetical protein CFOL_v3_00424 [Cephalotus follicularis]